MLTNEPLALSCRQVTARKAVHLPDLIALDKERLMQVAVMKVFRRAAGLTRQSKKKEGKGNGGKGKGGKGKGKAASSSTDPDGSAFVAKKAKVMTDTSTEESSETEASSSESHDDSYEKKVDKLSGDVGEPKPKSALAMPKPKVALALPKALPKAAALGKAKQNERVLETWAGKFPFAEIWSKDGTEHLGYGVTCGLHTNANGVAATTPCKKWLSLGKTEKLDREECAKRLKRWLVLGKIKGDSFNPECRRQSHISWGGMLLKDFASGVAGWDELDPDLDFFLSQM